MTQRTGLLQAVLDDPDDDGVRLVFADWLTDHGEEERAEFIRVQVALAGMGPTDERLPALAERERELLNAHAAAWCAELPRWGRDKVRFRRGFPAVVSCTQTQWINGRNLTQRAPIQALAASRYDPAKLEAFAATPHLAGVRALRPGAYTHPERAATVGALSGSACAAGLRLLDLHRGMYSHGSTAGDPVAVALAGATLPALECLWLSWGELGLDGVAALVNAPVAAGLRMLDLSTNPLGLAGAQAIASSPRLASLTALDLGDCHLSNAGVAALAGSPHLANLTHLNLRGDDLGPAAAEALADSPSLTNLTALTFHFGRLGLAGARALARSANFRHLTYLNLYGNHIGDAGLAVLAGSPYLANLRTLEVGANGLTPGGLGRLTPPHALANVERLGLCGNPECRGVEAARLRAPAFPRLRQVAFYPVWLEKAVEQAFAEHFEPRLGEAVAKRL